MANIIEVLLRMKSDTSGLQKFKQQIGGLKSLVGGLAVGAGLTALLRNINEAEAATAQLDAAFQATGRTVGLTRSRLDGLAAELQRTTKFGDDLVKEGEAILLTFDRVRGQAFEGTIKAAADLSARLGIDLKSSIRQVGLALQDPAAGLALLRRSGVAFTSEQKKLIESLVETNQLGRAQTIILGELQRRYGGAAQAARDTLGGALAGLKNAFGDLFEGTRESSKEAAEAINRISSALEDPRIKRGLDKLIGGLAEIAANAVEAAANLPNALGIVDPNDYSRGGGPRRGSPRALTDDTAAIVNPLQEFRVTVKRITADVPEFLQQMSEATKTETEKQITAYNNLKESLQALRSEGLISVEQQQARLSEGLDELLPEFDLNEIKAKYITLKRDTTELGEFMKGVWQSTGAAVRGSIADMFYEWKFSLRGMVDVARRAASEIAAAFLTAGIKKGALSLFGGLFSVGDQSALADSIFAFKAGGGNFDGPTVVGEDGPELVTGRGRVYNQRQMAFGGGGNITFAPVTKVQIIERDNPERTKQEIFQVMALENAKRDAEFVRLLGRSGVQVKG